MTNCKICQSCKKQKRLVAFHIHGRSRDGRVNTCMSCQSSGDDVKSVKDRIKLYFEEKKC